MPHLHAQRRSRGGAESRHHAVERDSAPQRRRGGGQRIGDLLHPVQREPDLAGAPRRRQLEPRSKIVVEDDALGAHVGVAERVTEDRTGADRGHARHIRIVEVQDRHAGGRQCGHELALRPGHPFEIAEELHVRHGDTRHDADIRSAHVGQARDVTRPARAHLEDDPLDIVRRIEEGKREPELVVEGPLAGCHHERRGEASLEQVLGRRLADRARDADHPALHALAREQAETKERHGGVLHDDRRPTDGLPLGEVGGRPALEGRADELVPVTLGDDGNVELPGQHRSGVDARSRDGDVGPDLFPTESGCEFRNGESHASRSRPIV